MSLSAVLLFLALSVQDGPSCDDFAVERRVSCVLEFMAELEVERVPVDNRSAAFADGVRALDQERWKEVVQLTVAAIELEPEPQRNKIAIERARFVSYVPYTLLTIAFSKLGRCNAAEYSLGVARVSVVAEKRELSLFERAVHSWESCLGWRVQNDSEGGEL